MACGGADPRAGFNSLLEMPNNTRSQLCRYPNRRFNSLLEMQNRAEALRRAEA